MIQTKLVPRTPSSPDYPLIIKQILKQSTKYEPQREIIYRDYFKYNYFELEKRVARFANVLTSLGVKAGDTVAFFDWDSHRYLEAFFAVPMIGAVLHTINVRLSPAQILYTMNHAEDKLVLVHEDFLPILEAIKDQITTVEKYVIISDKVYQDGATQNVEIPAGSFKVEGEYENLLKNAPETYDFPDFDENTWATTFYTTGTTGNPKGVYFSHRQIFLHTLGMLLFVGAYEAQGRFRSNDIYMPLTPMFHVHAWGLPYGATLLGTTQIYPGRYEPDMLLNLFVKHKVTFSHCVPTILQMFLTNPKASEVDFSKWKIIIGGSALNRALAKTALHMGIDIFAGYGMSETCPLMSFTLLSENMMKADMETQLSLRTRAGRIAPFVEIKIMDENGNFLPHDGETIGEVVSRAPWMTQGYYKEPEKSEELWKHGWLHTGDIGSITADNFVLIADRAKDVIKTGGEWVSSLEVENIISQVEGVAEVAVVGLPDDKWGERPHALVVLKAGFQGNVSIEKIKSAFQPLIESGDISKWFVPDKIAFVSEIPKTSVGKLDKKKIRTEMQETILSAASV